MNKHEAEFSNLVRSFRKRLMGKGPGKITTTEKAETYQADKDTKYLEKRIEELETETS